MLERFRFWSFNIITVPCAYCVSLRWNPGCRYRFHSENLRFEDWHVVNCALIEAIGVVSFVDFAVSGSGRLGHRETWEMASGCFLGSQSWALSYSVNRLSCVFAMHKYHYLRKYLRHGHNCCFQHADSCANK